MEKSCFSDTFVPKSRQNTIYCVYTNRKTTGYGGFSYVVEMVGVEPMTS